MTTDARDLDARHLDARDVDRLDAGFTLAEILVTVMVLALVSAALSTTVVTLLRTTPRITQMVDDSQGELRMLSALERDIGSTPPTGVDITSWASGCTGADPGKNVIQLTWNDGTLVRRAAYRLVTSSTETWVERRTCSGGSLSQLVQGRTSRVARALTKPPDNWAGGAAPVKVTVASNRVTVVLTQVSGVITFSSTLQTSLGVLP